MARGSNDLQPLSFIVTVTARTSARLNHGIIPLPPGLYDHLWSYPISKMTVEFGVSSPAIAKACAKMQVPVPLGGYWARKVAGESVIRARHGQAATAGRLTAAVSLAEPTVSRLMWRR